MAFKNATKAHLDGTTVGTADIDALAVTAAKLAANAVTNAKLDAIARGSVKVGGTANAATDLVAKTSGQTLVGDGTDIKSVAISGDATLAASGALTIAAGVVTGAKQSATAATKSVQVLVGTLATAADEEAIVVAPCAGTLSLVTLSGKDALTANDTNYQAFVLTNKGQAGAGSTLMLSQTAGAASTKATGGQGLVAYGKCIIPLHATGANLVVAKGDTLVFTATHNGTPANTVTETVLALEFTYTA